MDQTDGLPRGEEIAGGFSEEKETGDGLPREEKIAGGFPEEKETGDGLPREEDIINEGIKKDPIEAEPFNGHGSLPVTPRGMEERPASGAAASRHGDEYEDDYEDEYEEDLRKRSPIAAAALIFGIISVISGLFGCILFFSSAGLAAAFFAPSVIALVLGFIGFKTTGPEGERKGRALALCGLILGGLSLVLWLAAMIYLRFTVGAEYGNTELITVLQAVFAKA